MYAFSSDLIYQAVNTLFNSSDATDRKEANKLLEEFKKSPQAWSVANEMLFENRDLQASYIAAQTIRNNIQVSFKELPTDTHESLRDSLLTHICQINEHTDGRITTQLCLAVADLALLMPTWTNPIQDLLNTLAPKPLAVLPLLEILKFLPEELNSVNLLSEEQEAFRKEMDNCSPNVVKLLCMCTQRTDLDKERLLNSTLQCLSSWLQNTFLIDYVFDSSIVQETFVYLSQQESAGEMHDNATEVICDLILSIESDSDPERQLQIFNAVCMLESAYQFSVAHKNTSKAMNYCHIFTTLCETFLYNMLNEDGMPHYSIKALDLVLSCVGHCDYQVVEITFDAWSRLSDELSQRNSDTLNAYFKPYIERLFGAVYQRSQMGSDQKGLIDECSPFYEFREKVSDLIEEIANLFGSDACFKQMFLLLHSPTATWESTEVALFFMQSVAKNISSKENETIPKVIEGIVSLPENTHIAVRHASIVLLGELCNWIENHPELLPSVLNSLLYALQHKNGLASVGFKTIIRICTACRKKMVSHINCFVQIARFLDTFEIKNDIAIKLLKWISSIVTRLPLEQLGPTLRELVAIELQPLALMVENKPESTIQIGERTDPVYWINRTCALIERTRPNISNDENHPTVPILINVWSVMSGVLDKYEADERIVKRTCQVIHHCIFILHKQAAILFQPLAKQMVVLFAKHRYSCILFLGSTLICKLTSEFIPALFEMLQAFMEPAFNMLQVQETDLVHSFLSLVSDYLNFYPLPLLRGAYEPVIKFFIKIFKCGYTEKYHSTVSKIAKAYGKELVTYLMYACVFSLPSGMLFNVAEIFTHLKHFLTSEQMAVILRLGLADQICGFAMERQKIDVTNSLLSADTMESIIEALETFTAPFRSFQ